MFPDDCPPLSPSFFARSTLTVARELLGCLLLRHEPESGRWLRCVIVETEAYTGDDPACHAYGRTTGRAETLYHHPGTAYVYLIYGMYHCLNVVTEPYGIPGAVLFRALEPPPGEALRTNGPGRLTGALSIHREAFNGKPLTLSETGLYLSAGTPVADAHIVQTTRIGISRGTELPWRFYIRDNPWVSVVKKTKSFPTSLSPP